MKTQRGIVLAASFLLLTGSSVPVQSADSNGDSAAPPVVAPGFTAPRNAAPTTPPAATAKPAPAAADPSVPDFLKEYAPAQSELIPPPPLAGSTPPSAQVTPVAPVVPRPRTTSAPTQSAAAKPTKMLVGRLEELGGSGAKLPIGVLMKLKIGTAKLDPSATKPTVVQGVVSSFPVDFQGQWGGQLKVHWAQFDPASYTFDREETLLTQKIETPGAMAGTTFNFVQQGNVISVEPAQLYFAPRRDTANAKAMQQQLGPLAGMLGGGNSQMLSMMTESIPVMVLGSATGLRGLTGNALESRVIKNDIRQLKPGVLEQNIVVQESEQHRSTGSVQRSLSETVMRFTKLNAGQLYVQAASIKYRNDGHFLNKVLFYGTVNRGQSGAPPGMGAGGLPGMPGMSPSGGGMGGLGDIQNMLKQLQGGY